MYRIERTSYGLRVTLGGEITVAEMIQLRAEAAALLATMKRPFGVIADIRTVIPFEPEVKVLLREVEQMSANAGLQRRAVIFQSPVMKGQAAQLSFQSETNEIERRINAAITDDWEQIALAWVVEGVEPSHTPNADSAQSN